MRMKIMLSIILAVALLIGVVVIIVNKPPEAIEFRIGCGGSSSDVYIFEVKRDGVLRVSTGFLNNAKDFKTKPFFSAVNDTGEIKLSQSQIEELNGMVLEASKYEERNFYHGALRDKDGNIIEDLMVFDASEFNFYLQGKSINL